MTPAMEPPAHTPLTNVHSVHETVLYAADPPTAARFYQHILGLRAVGTTDNDSAALRLPHGDAVLLIFRPGYAATPGRGVPTHGSAAPGHSGAGHVAFRIAPGSLPAWRSKLESQSIPIELERTWNRGGASIYIRDPAGNSVELVDGTIWPS